MSFPTKIIGTPIGWKDLGELPSKAVLLPKEEWTTVNYSGIGSYTEKYKHLSKVHTFCRTTARLGKEKGKVFIYCPLCQVKLSLNS